jgi:hypothetical protein
MARCADPVARLAAGDAAAFVYHDMTDPSLWSTFDLGALDAGAGGEIAGAAFDGRFFYFAPGVIAGFKRPFSIAVRYDSLGAFDAVSSWSPFDLTNTNPQAGGFGGATFEGRYVYFVPRHSVDGGGLAGFGGLALRYDPSAPFAAAGSWESFDVSKVSAAAAGFSGGAFDGRYVYFGPQNGVDMARYDPQKPFGDPSAWVLLDMGAVAFRANAGGLFFDGQHALYVVPAEQSPPNYALRYDTAASFGATTSWGSYDVWSIATENFHGAGFDGRYVYFAPVTDQSDAGRGQPGRKVLRYDSLADFEQASAWSTFDLAAANANGGFNDAVFDGRYVYFVPRLGSNLVRYDTSAPFAAPSSWATFDLTLVRNQLGFLAGAVFDGRYVLFFPSSSNLAARFDARELRH